MIRIVEAQGARLLNPRHVVDLLVVDHTPDVDVTWLHGARTSTQTFDSFVERDEFVDDAIKQIDGVTT